MNIIAENMIILYIISFAISPGKIDYCYQVLVDFIKFPDSTFFIEISFTLYLLEISCLSMILRLVIGALTVYVFFGFHCYCKIVLRHCVIINIKYPTFVFSS